LSLLDEKIDGNQNVEILYNLALKPITQQVANITEKNSDRGFGNTLSLFKLFC
jgi:hypothetical protein